MGTKRTWGLFVVLAVVVGLTSACGSSTGTGGAGGGITAGPAAHDAKHGSAKHGSATGRSWTCEAENALHQECRYYVSRRTTKRLAAKLSGHPKTGRVARRAVVTATATACKVGRRSPMLALGCGPIVNHVLASGGRAVSRAARHDRCLVVTVKLTALVPTDVTLSTSGSRTHCR